MTQLFEKLDQFPIWSHLLTIGGFVLALLLIARLLAEKRQPGNTFAWLLGILLVPYLGVPLYLVFGGRKIQKLLARKSRLQLDLAGLTTDVDAQLLPTVQAINASGAMPPVGGNRVELLETGEQAYAALERHILEARHSIHITTFILSRDDTGKRIVKLLARRAREGIKVRLLIDAIGSFLTGYGFVRSIREAGGEVSRFMPVFQLPFRHSANLRNHRKIAIFDQRVAILGGHNLATQYMGPTPRKKRWRDFGVVLSGPSAALLNEVFLADWSFAADQPLAKLHEESSAQPISESLGASVAQVIASGPDVQGDPLYEGIVSMIQEARQSIIIVTPYFIPDEVLLRSLIVKARAGIEVTLILPARSDHRIVDYARHHYVRQLHEAGAKIRYFQTGMLHAKALICDDRYALLGSANFDLRSLFVNFEIGLLLCTREDIENIRAWTDRLLLESREPRLRASKNFWINAREELCRLLAPLL